MTEAAHWGYVAAAYAAGLFVVGALVLHAVLDARAQRRILASLETRAASPRRPARGGLPQAGAPAADGRPQVQP